MNKTLKIILIVVAVFVVIFAGIVISAFVAVNNAANADEYTIGTDSVKSIKAIVEKRDVSSISVDIKDGITTQKVEYTKVENVQKDLLAYVGYLRNSAGFLLTSDMNLNLTSSKVELGKDSTEKGQILLITIEYNENSYTITFQKGPGSLTNYNVES